MGSALKGVAEQPFTAPAGVVAVKVNPETGARAGEGEPGVVDYFYQEFPPPEGGIAIGIPGGGERPAEEVRNQLF